jgi:hypothetical protein
MRSSSRKLYLRFKTFCGYTDFVLYINFDTIYHNLITVWKNIISFHVENIFNYLLHKHSNVRLGNERETLKIFELILCCINV